MYAKVEGDTRDFGYILPNHQEYAAFERGFVDASLVVEFNFLDIGESGYYKGTYKVTPYILLGVDLLYITICTQQRICTTLTYLRYW